MSLFGHLGCFGGLHQQGEKIRDRMALGEQSPGPPILTRGEAISSPREEKAPVRSKGRGDQTGIGSISLGQFQPWAISYHPVTPLWCRPSQKKAKRTENQVSFPNQAGAKSLEVERVGSTDQHTPSTGLSKGKNRMGGGLKVSQKQLEGWFGVKTKGSEADLSVSTNAGDTSLEEETPNQGAPQG